MRIIKLKPIINKANGQINISLPKTKLSKSFLKDSPSMKSIKIKIEGWEI